MTLLEAPPVAPRPARSGHRAVIIATFVLLACVVALGVFALRLKRRAEFAQAHISDTKPITPPVAGPAQQVPLVIAYDDEDTLRRNTITESMPTERSERARRSIQSLLDFCSNGGSPHPLPPGSEVKNVFLVGDDLAIVDFNAVFADQHRSGIFVEELTIASVAQTLAANVPGITRVKILIDGKERETLAGHASLKAVYDIATLNSTLRVE